MKLLIALIAAIAPAVCIADSKIDDWIWSESNAENDFLYAVTVTTNSTMIGQYCYISTGDCYYMLNAKITCESESEHVTLVNSDVGSNTVKAICGHEVEGNNILYLYPFDEIDRMVRESNNIGVAIAMESGHFKVVRFSLAGSSKAIDSMREIAAKLHEEKKGEQPLDLEEIL